MSVASAPARAPITLRLVTMPQKQPRSSTMGDKVLLHDGVDYLVVIGGNAERWAEVAADKLGDAVALLAFH